MSREGIVDSYLNGEISRRTFVRRLVAAGVAFSAATAYAELLRPAWADAATVNCTYVAGHYASGHYDPAHYECHYETAPGGTPQTQPAQQQGQIAAADTTAPHGRFGHLGTISLATLLLTGRFVVKYKTDEAGNVVIIASLILPNTGASETRRIVLGRGRAKFSKPGTKKIAVKLTKGGRRTLLKLRKHRHHHRHKVQILATNTDKAGNSRKRRLNVKLR